MSGGQLTKAQTARHLQREIGPDPFTDFRLQWGVVDGVNTGPPLSVNVVINAPSGGSVNSTPNLRYLAGYSPTIGDYVAVIRLGSDRIVLGILA